MESGEISDLVFPQLANACSKLTIETLEQSGRVNNKDTFVNFEHILYLVLVFLLLTLGKYMSTGFNIRITSTNQIEVFLNYELTNDLANSTKCIFKD